MKVGSLALAAVALCARRGDDNACAGGHSEKTRAKARARARDNASNAIAPQCLNGVTRGIAQQACTRVNLLANASTNSAWVDSPPAAKPGADNVRYIGRGIDRAAGVNLCVVAHDIRLRTRNVVDGKCPHDRRLLPHRTFATGRAWARCGVICRTP
jgi:hypothetical protein